MPPRLSSSLRRRPGRPRKFATPSRAVTVTLPESVFEILRGVDSDVSRRRAGVLLVPLPDGRALISFDQPTTVEELELLLYDAIDDAELATGMRRAR